MDPSKAVVYIRAGATPKVMADTQSGSQSHQPMMLATGAYLNYSTVQCKRSLRFLDL